VLLRISYDSLKELYFQNPKLGFYFLRLVSERLFQNHAATVSAASAA
jgi:CRP/FNR family transcriptional regulator, cyclic AMP receptor protein